MTSRIHEFLDSNSFEDTPVRQRLDPGFGGAGGHMPDFSKWINSQAHLDGQARAVVLQTPNFYKQFGSDVADNLITMSRAYFETHVRSFEGLNYGLSVETDEHAFGGAGEMFEEYTDVKRARSTPSVTVVEKYGRPFQTWLNFQIRYGLMDPETKTSMVRSLSQRTATHNLSSNYSHTVLFYTTDPMDYEVDKAIICTNMFPKGEGPVELRRNLTEARSILTLTTEWTALSVTGNGVMSLAQALHNQLQLVNANPIYRPALVGQIDPDILNNERGYAHDLRRQVDSNVLSGAMETGGMV